MGVLSAGRVLARAGGGHSFSGGGSGGGGGHSFGGGSHVFFAGGGGGGGGGVIGLVVIVIILVVVGLVIASRRRGRSSDGPPTWTQGPGSGASQPGGGPSNPGATPPPGATASGGQPQPWAGQSGASTPAGDWDHGDRPAAASVRGTLFPGTEPGASGGPPAVGEDPATGLAAISAHDPQFDREGFLEQCQRCFFIVQEAWSERKPEMSRQVMADGLWQQHRVQIQGYVDEHKRNILGDLAVGSINVVSAHSDTRYDTVVVRVTAACSDYDVDDGGKVIRGNKRVGQWAEDWTFQRSSKAVTQDHGGTLSQKCPNCGAPLNVDLAGVCPYCKAPVMSGEYDWVLARISQLTV